MSLNNQLALSLNLISTHLLQIVEQLYREMQDNDENQQSPNFCLLLVSEPEITEHLEQQLGNSQHPITVTSLSVTEFLSAAFNQRYNLGCFIDPSFLSNDPTALTDSSTVNNRQPHRANTYQDAYQKDYQSVAIRLRDLFAEQCLFLTYASSSKLKLNSLGYIPITIETEDNLSALVSWQFNLYDYKQRPDWLNAKYWANPENFDKYRW